MNNYNFFTYNNIKQIGLEVYNMKIINGVALTLVIVGAINWLLVGLFEFNLVDAIFGSLSALTRIIYTLVGIAGLWCIALYSKICHE